ANPDVVMVDAPGEAANVQTKAAAAKKRREEALTSLRNPKRKYVLNQLKVVRHGLAKLVEAGLVDQMEALFRAKDRGELGRLLQLTNVAGATQAGAPSSATPTAPPAAAPPVAPPGTTDSPSAPPSTSPRGGWRPGGGS
ncbi:MAG: hypothetical protein ACK4NQ_11460, partial [Fimbriimonadaceae bacterium]